MCGARPGFSKKKDREGSDVQVEIRVEVDERFERLVRLTIVVREDGDRRLPLIVRC